MPRPARAAAGCIAVLVAILVGSITQQAGAVPPRHTTPQVVNGFDVSPADFATTWQFLVALVDPAAASQYDGQFCGGSLIDDQHVLTAAHCLTARRGVTFNPRSVGVVAKERVLDDRTLGRGETGVRAVADIFIHPGFEENGGEGFRNDVAVVRLGAPVTGVTPIALVQEADGGAWGNGAGGVSARIAGWGNTDPAGSRNPSRAYPTIAQQTTIPIRPDSTCAATVGGGYGTAFERATNLCAGTLQSGTRRLGTDACQGDSGGPMIVGVADGSYRLAGLTSWGEGCAQKYYGAYSRVAALRGWVDSIPGATDGGSASGGPGGLQQVSAVRQAGGSYDRLTLAWDPPATGPTPERYAVWKRIITDGQGADQLVGLTSSPRLTVRVAPTRRLATTTWNIRAVDAAGSNGPSRLFAAGPTPDLRPPGRTTHPALVRRTGTTLVVRWSAARDRQSGIARYQAQRRVVGEGGWRTMGSVPAGRRSVRIANLRAGARVQVRIRAIDRAGNRGTWSPMGTFRLMA
jgi:secreted trypsin-like serine protease